MREYYYLVASLPMLEHGMKMPISYNDFLRFAQEQLTTHDMEIIKRVSMLPQEDTKDPSSTLREWKRFDTALRGEIARFRAIKKSKDPSKYLLQDVSIDHSITSFAHWAVNQDSPLEAEVSLDRFRWEKIEEMEKGHYFDIDYLITYALKLQILKRWERINSGRGPEILEGLLEKSSV